MNDIVLPPIGHFLGGEYVASASGKTFTNTAPASEDIIAEIPLGDSETIAEAVQASRMSRWSETSAHARVAVLYKIADLIDARRHQLALLEAWDSGKPYQEAYTGDILRAASNFRFFADLLKQQAAPAFISEDGSTHITTREPLGLVGLITPWNLPLYLATWKLAPALAMGNRVILKPAELTPMTAMAMGEIFNEAGLPAGTVGIVQGFGQGSAGEALVAHPEVSAISFTGETVTGAAIMARAADTLKKVSFELGGKGASVVFADADLERAVPTLSRAAFRNQGQICLAGSRLLVHESRHDEVVNKLQALIGDIIVGDPLDPQTTMGSLVSTTHRDKVAGFIHYARTETNAEILCGGGIPQAFPKGAYFEPTLIDRVEQSSRLVQEEIFGPVLTVQTFATEDEALSLLNGTPYGLSCSIWTQDEARARRTAAQARMGLVWINSWFKRNLHTAFGGMKASGVGREGGNYSLDFFSELKTTTWG